MNWVDDIPSLEELLSVTDANNMHDEEEESRNRRPSTHLHVEKRHEKNRQVI